MTGQRERRGDRARLVDVARLAGVSAQTVSNVVNNRRGVTEETRQRVISAVAQTGYRPNRAAKNLRTRRAGEIAFHLTQTQMELRNPFTLTLLRSLVGSVDRSGYRVVVVTQTDASPDHFRAEAEKRDVDGFVLSDCDYEDHRTRILAELSVPFVAMGRTPASLPQTWVDIDNRAAIALAVDHLVARGARTFGYIGYAGGQFWVVERREGALDRLAFHGITVPESLWVTTTPETLHQDMRALLARPDRPEALITASDSIAVVLVNAAHTLGLAVGRDILVTGFDGSSLGGIVEPALTTVRIPVERIAAELVERLIGVLDGRAPDRGLIVPTTLALGGTA